MSKNSKPSAPKVVAPEVVKNVQEVAEVVTPEVQATVVEEPKVAEIVEAPKAEAPTVPVVEEAPKAPVAAAINPPRKTGRSGFNANC